MASGVPPFHTRYHAERDPDALAFKMSDTGETVSFGELEARANQGAHLIRSMGIDVGDHIAILMENRREFLELCFAADRAGVYYTTISTHLMPEEIAYMPHQPVLKPRLRMKFKVWICFILRELRVARRVLNGI